MTIEEAVEARHSVRAYQNRPLTDEAVKPLRERIAALNESAQLHIQLVLNEPKAFYGRLAKYGKFRNVTNYIIMAGRKADDLDERIGYYGQQLVLLAQTLGLNSCWVGLTYSKVPGTYVLNDGETIKAYIAIGYGETQGIVHRTKSLEQVSNADDLSPEWFRRGVAAALLAPTATNQQKFFFELMPAEDGKRPCVLAKRIFSIIGYTRIDLGIAKCNFEIGAGKENFDWKQS